MSHIFVFLLEACKSKKGSKPSDRAEITNMDGLWLVETSKKSENNMNYYQITKKGNIDSLENIDYAMTPSFYLGISEILCLLQNGVRRQTKHRVL